MIKHSDMVKELVKSGQDIINDLTPESVHNLHMAVGLCGEVAELLEAIRDGEDNILEELGDIEFYFEGLQQGVEYSISDSYRSIEFMHWSPRHLLEALSIEAGNILDAVKKQAIYAKDMDTARVRGLVLDFRAILNEVYRSEGVKSTPYMAKNHNIHKLGKRYEGFKYSNEAAQTRADKE